MHREKKFHKICLAFLLQERNGRTRDCPFNEIGRQYLVCGQKNIWKTVQSFALIIFALVQSDQTVERKQERIRTNIHFESNLSIFTVSLYMYDCMYVYSILSPFPNQTFFCTPSTHNSFLPTHIDILFSWHTYIPENRGKFWKKKVGL